MYKGLTSITQFNRNDLENIIKNSLSYYIKSERNKNLKDKIIGLFFFEESTRTRIGLEAAILRCGGTSIFLEQTKHSKKMYEAESLEDSIRSIQTYCDLLCIRHTNEHAIQKLVPSLVKPIINCGNGDDEHPVQTLIDLATIYHSFSCLDGLRIAIVGNLKFSRAAHSLLLALSRFSRIHVIAISPPKLKVPSTYKEAFLKSGNTYEEINKMDFKGIDVIYMAGFPRKTPLGTFTKKEVYEYVLNLNTTKKLKPTTIILCPLPRIDEITIDVDKTKYAHYFKQSEIGLYVRMVVLEKYLG